MTTRSITASLTLFAGACGLAEIEDRSLENVTLTGADAEEGATLEGDLVVSAGATEGDWLLAFDDAEIGYHSPSRADLSWLGGTASVLILGSDDSAPGLLVSDVAGLAFVSSSSTQEDGTSAFGHAVWSMGEAVGRGVVFNEDDEPRDVAFHEVRFATDDGEVILLPGEPTTLHIDGGEWRATVVAAWTTDGSRGQKCEDPDVLSLELVRGEAGAGEQLAPVEPAIAPTGMCG